MVTVEERIAEIEQELSKTKYNKATSAHFATLRAQLSKLRTEVIEQTQRSRAKRGTGFAIKKHGDATVILLGFPSVGKSSLLNAITNKESRVAAYDFTTLDAIPGMMNYDGKYAGCRVQIIDLPGIIQDAAQGKGRGREVFSAVRNSDLILIMLDVQRPIDYDIILKELYDANVRLDKKPKNIVINMKDRGGITVTGHMTTVDFGLNEIQNILHEYRITNADVFINEPGITLDDVIDKVAGNRVYVPSLIVVNKVDLVDRKVLEELKEKIGYFVPISADKEWNLDILKEKIVDKIQLMRIYLKRPSQKAEFDEPMIIKQDSTVQDIAEKIHRRFMEDFRYASVWGKSVKYPGQKVGLDHILVDGDIIQIVLKK